MGRYLFPLAFIGQRLFLFHFLEGAASETSLSLHEDFWCYPVGGATKVKGNL